MSPATALPEISLPRFEGPLDLLLELVRKNEVLITDIPISEITRQYLDYLHRADKLDIELGSEFAYIAALLIHIKSRSLLATDPEIAAREEDPRQELVRMLVDHDRLRQAAEFLKQKLEISGASWSTCSIEQYLTPAPDESSSATSGAMNLLEVLRLAQQALEAARIYEIVTPAESVTVKEMILWLEERLEPQSPLDAEPLFAQQSTVARMAALFLALLEMAKTLRIELQQQQCFGTIRICRVAGCH